MMHKYEIKRYNLGIPIEMYNVVKAIADEEDSSVLDIFKKLIMTGLVLYKEQKKLDTKILIEREGERAVEVVFP